MVRCGFGCSWWKWVCVVSVGMVGRQIVAIPTPPTPLAVLLNETGRYASGTVVRYYSLRPEDGPCDGAASIGTPALDGNGDTRQVSWVERCFLFDPPLQHRVSAVHTLRAASNSDSIPALELKSEIEPSHHHADLVAMRMVHEAMPAGSELLAQHAKASKMTNSGVQDALQKTVASGIRQAIRSSQFKVKTALHSERRGLATVASWVSNPNLRIYWVAFGGGIGIGQAMLPVGSIDETKAKFGIDSDGESMLRELGTLQEGDLVIEVGAQQGLRTAGYAAGVGSGGKVIALESRPAFARLTRTNVDLMGMKQRVTVLNAMMVDHVATEAGQHWSMIHDWGTFETLSSVNVREGGEKAGHANLHAYSPEIGAKHPDTNVPYPKASAAIPSFTIDDIVFGPPGDGERREWGWGVEDWIGVQQDEGNASTVVVDGQGESTGAREDVVVEEEEGVGVLRLVLRWVKWMCRVLLPLESPPRTESGYTPMWSYSPVARSWLMTMSKGSSVGETPSATNSEKRLRGELNARKAPRGTSPPSPPFPKTHFSLHRALLEADLLYQTSNEKKEELMPGVIARQHTSPTALRRYDHSVRAHALATRAQVAPALAGGGRFAAWVQPARSKSHPPPLYDRPPRLRRCPAILRVSESDRAGRVLLGATETLARCAPVVSVAAANSAGAAAAMSILHEASYSCYWVVDPVGRHDSRLRDEKRGTLHARVGGNATRAASDIGNWHVDLMCTPLEPATSRAFHSSRKWWRSRPFSMLHYGLTKAIPENLAHRWRGHRAFPTDSTLGLPGRLQVERGEVFSKTFPIPVSIIPAPIRRYFKASTIPKRPWNMFDAWFTSYPHVIDAFDGTPRLFHFTSPYSTEPLKEKIKRDLHSLGDSDSSKLFTSPARFFHNLTLIKRVRFTEEAKRSQEYVNRAKAAAGEV